MKKSAKVTLTVVATIGLASCNRRRVDPCEAANFNEQACQQAVQNGGYFWGGSWIPMTYSYPYPYYYDSYRRYAEGGHAVHPAPMERYAQPAGKTFGGHPASAPGVSRGGFGSIGAGHGAGA